MDSYKLAIKLFVQDGSGLTDPEFIPIFHRWIQTHAIADHLLIDVADYAHVPQGPGTMLITHEANFAMDHGGGELGLLYVRRQPFVTAATFTDRLRLIAKYATDAATRLEHEPALAGKIKFRTDEFAIRIYDRLLAPNTAETFAAVKPELEAFAAALYGQAPAGLESTASAESLFEVRVKAASSPTLESLMAKL